MFLASSVSLSRHSKSSLIGVAHAEVLEEAGPRDEVVMALVAMLVAMDETLALRVRPSGTGRVSVLLGSLYRFPRFGFCGVQAGEVLTAGGVAGLTTVPIFKVITLALEPGLKVDTGLSETLVEIAQAPVVTNGRVLLLAPVPVPVAAAYEFLRPGTVLPLFTDAGDGDWDKGGKLSVGTMPAVRAEGLLNRLSVSVVLGVGGGKRSRGGRKAGRIGEGGGDPFLTASLNEIDLEPGSIDFTVTLGCVGLAVFPDVLLTAPDANR